MFVCKLTLKVVYGFDHNVIYCILTRGLHSPSAFLVFNELIIFLTYSSCQVGKERQLPAGGKS